MNRSLLVTLIGCLLWVPLFAQSPDCTETGRLMRLHLKEKRYAQAAEVFEGMPLGCTAGDDGILADAEKVLDYQINLTDNRQTQKPYVAKLIEMYDLYQKTHPQNTKSLMVRKAMLMDKHEMAPADKILALLDDSFTRDRDNFKDSQALYRYFELMAAAHKKGDKSVPDARLFAAYDDLSIHLMRLSSMADDVYRRRYRATTNGIRALMNPVPDCRLLTDYYEKAFEKRSVDTLWLETVIKGIYPKSCGNNELVLKASQKWFELSPTADAAENLAMLHMRTGQKEKGLGLMQQAIGLEKDKTKRAQLRYNLAVFNQSDKPAAFAQLKQALEENPKFGKAYLLLAQMYSGANDCATNQFEVKALNYLAAQTAQKAGEVEPGLKASASKQASDFLKKVPTSDEIKKAGMGGKTHTFGCWINQQVVIPKP